MTDAQTPPPAVTEALRYLRDYRTRRGSERAVASRPGPEYYAALSVLAAHLHAGTGPGGERARAIEECARIADALAKDQQAEADRFAEDGVDVWSLICVAHADTAETLATEFRALLPTPAPAASAHR